MGLDSMSRQRVLIIHEEGNAANNPSLRCIIHSLLSIFSGVDILVRARDVGITYPDWPGVNWILQRPVAWQLKKAVFIGLGFKPGAFFVTRFFSRTRYALLIGVDRQGLLEAAALSRASRTPCCMVSFEIEYANETSRRYKSSERLAAAELRLAIVQDEVRAADLIAENGIQQDSIFILPLASRGLAKPGGAKRLRDSMGIPRDRKVAISIGSIEDWSMVDRIIKSISSWPDDWVLLLHDRYGNTSKSLQSIGGIPSGLLERIFVSNDAVEDVDSLDHILAGIDCGLAFYDSKILGLNIEHVGRSSGKVSTYLRYGVPVITNAGGQWLDDMERHQIGSWMENPDGLGGVLGDWDSDLMSANCRRFFSEVLDYGIYETALLNRLEQVADPDRGTTDIT
jgi:hypothetical protein